MCGNGRGATDSAGPSALGDPAKSPPLSPVRRRSGRRRPSTDPSPSSAGTYSPPAPAGRAADRSRPRSRLRSRRPGSGLLRAGGDRRPVEHLPRLASLVPANAATLGRCGDELVRRGKGALASSSRPALGTVAGARASRHDGSACALDGHQPRFAAVASEGVAAVARSPRQPGAAVSRSARSDLVVSIASCRRAVIGVDVLGLVQKRVTAFGFVALAVAAILVERTADCPGFRFRFPWRSPTRSGTSSSDARSWPCSDHGGREHRVFPAAVSWSWAVALGCSALSGRPLRPAALVAGASMIPVCSGAGARSRRRASATRGPRSEPRERPSCSRPRRSR